MAMLNNQRVDPIVFKLSSMSCHMLAECSWFFFACLAKGRLFIPEFPGNALADTRVCLKKGD